MCMSGSCLKTNTVEVNSTLALGNGAYILLRTSSEEAKRYSPVGMIVCVADPQNLARMHLEAPDHLELRLLVDVTAR